MRRPVPSATQAWVEIVVANNADDLLRYVERRVDQREDAADLLGKIFLVLWEKAARVPLTDEAARMWCFGIARNAVREHRRRSTRRLDLANALRDHLRDAPQPDNSADAAAEAAIRASEVRKGLLLLNEPARELVILVYWDGFSLADAARLLRINESTARTRHARALRRLETALEPRERRVPAGASLG